MPWLLQRFEEESTIVQDAIVQYAANHTVIITEASESAHYIPTRVYAACLPSLTEEEAQELRPFLSDDSFDLVCTSNRKPKFDNTNVNREILLHFKKWGWISSFKVEAGFIRAYPKTSIVKKL